jgi:hypothetical protein
MKLLKRSRYLLAIAMLTLVYSFHVPSQQAASPNPAQTVAAEPYPNSPEGLQQLLLELLRTARSDDQPKLRAEIAVMEIPDYENWFMRTFGQDKGQKIGDMYEESLKASELHFEMLWVELAKQQGLISVERLDSENIRIAGGCAGGVQGELEENGRFGRAEYPIHWDFLFRGGKVSGGRVAPRCARPLHE